MEKEALAITLCTLSSYEMVYSTRPEHGQHGPKMARHNHIFWLDGSGLGREILAQ
jgi:hypothetical protein